MDEFFIDLFIRKNMAEALLKRVYEYFKKAGKYLDIVWTSDDYDAQEQLSISRPMWVKMVKSWVKKCVEFIKNRMNVKLFYHT